MLLLMAIAYAAPSWGEELRRLPAWVRANGVRARARIGLGRDAAGTESMVVHHTARFSYLSGGAPRLTIHLDDGSSWLLSPGPQNGGPIRGPFHGRFMVSLPDDIVNAADPVALVWTSGSNVTRFELKRRGRARVEACLRAATNDGSGASDAVFMEASQAPDCGGRGESPPRYQPVLEQCCLARWYGHRGDVGGVEASFRQARSLRRDLGLDGKTWRRMAGTFRDVRRAARSQD